ncbi:glycosyl hydrolase [Kalaharituber pfeilii]|nr:glycosyl hydrolase [Kalaharituber pfeilii]
MMTRIAAALLVAAFVPATFAQQSLYGQCNGTGGGSSTTSSTMLRTTTSSASTTKTASYGTFTNPVVYEDFADNDVFLGPDNAYYFSASNMHYSPGAPILKSYDLVNWEFIGHSLPTLSYSSRYNMTNGETKYLGGSWASTMRYRRSNGLWYWIGCIEFRNTYIYTARTPTGPWTIRSVLYGKCYYDCGLMIDDDDTINVSMAQLSADGFSEVRSERIFSSPPGTNSIEGSRLYKRNGMYYILESYPSGQSTLIWKASSPWGPWSYKFLGQNVGSPVAGGGAPHQGSLIETPDGKWYFMSFTWAYPAGRMPVLAPPNTCQWKMGASYPAPLPLRSTPTWTGTDTFQGTSLGVAWEWNHNADPAKYSVNNGLTLYTATITTDLYKARNTLTHRLHGPYPVATIATDFSNMADGDRCGLAAFRHRTAYIGVRRSGNSYSLVVVHGVDQSETDWSTISTGTTVATQTISKGKIWLRGSMDARPNGTKLVSFAYSMDGTTFTSFGSAYTMNTNWQYFIGYRWGIFNHATTALGGSIKVSSFTQT